MSEAMQPGQVATVKTPGGASFDANRTANGTILVSTGADGDRNTIVVQGGPTDGTAELDILGGIGDGILAILGAAKKLLGCTMTTTTTVNVGADGKVSSVVTTTTCASA